MFLVGAVCSDVISDNLLILSCPLLDRSTGNSLTLAGRVVFLLHQGGVIDWAPANVGPPGKIQLGQEHMAFFGIFLGEGVHIWSAGWKYKYSFLY